MSEPLHLLQNDVWQVGLLPGTGMSTAFGRVRQGADFVDVLRPTAESAYGHASDCASFLLVPWSNRLKDARFVFRGREHRLRSNAVDGTAIHGFGRDYPWRVEKADKAALSARFDSRDIDHPNFPFPFSARAEFRLDGAGFSTTVSLRNEGTEPMPGGFGHHPYFRRTIRGPTDGAEVQIPCDEYFETDACIPRGAPVPIPPPLDFRKLRALEPDLKLDHCFTTRRPGAPIRLVYPQSDLEIRFDLDPLFETVVVYVPPGKPDFAIEPVTNANDGFNLYERGIRNSGVFVLSPGEERSATITLAIARP